ncbi:two-component response regulator-like PRR37 isoform X2 [Lolium perenne]|uniref:two-component response regulator-like PRR37 isoform X2 n=1 Tax=Lolium perenne TaxID=4522 RepID=UPI0021F5EADF|nr:two-component response regulator-like PRR37 isoform X2 [Lolium perenne]
MSSYMDQQQPRPPPPSGDHAAHPLTWARFVEKENVWVLLVEADKTTRLAITDLLRVCNYQVLAAEDGRQAWAFLQVQGIHNNIDLVLTEADLSGIELLDRVMDHGVCKHIPIIVMSNCDSLGTVFSCLSKGAVHFLKKPIRQQEVKSLWQHIWKRFNSSSWTKRAVVIDGPQAMAPDHSTEHLDSTCALVIHPNSTRWVPDTADLIGLMAKSMDVQQAARAKDAPNCSSKLVPWLELSLKRPRSTGYYANAIQVATRNVLGRTNISAITRIFSTYNNSSAVSNQGGAGFTESFLPHGNSSEVAKTDSPYNMKSSSDAGLMKQGKDMNHNMPSLE